MGGSVIAAGCMSKLCSFGGWAAATCAALPVSLLASTSLHIVNRYSSDFPVSDSIKMSRPFRPLTFNMDGWNTYV